MAVSRQHCYGSVITGNCRLLTSGGGIVHEDDFVQDVGGRAVEDAVYGA